MIKKVKFYSRSRKVTVPLFYKGGVNAYFLTDSFSKKTVVFEATIFVGQSEDGAEVRCEISRRVETAVSRYSGPSALRFLRCPGFQLFTRVGNPIFASYLARTPTYLLFLVDFPRKTNLPTY